MAKAIAPTSFDNRFAIYNLDRFISTLSLFNDPELIFKDKYHILDQLDKQEALSYYLEKIHGGKK